MAPILQWSQSYEILQADLLAHWLALSLSLNNGIVLYCK